MATIAIRHTGKYSCTHISCLLAAHMWIKSRNRRDFGGQQQAHTKTGRGPTAPAYPPDANQHNYTATLRLCLRWRHLRLCGLFCLVALPRQSNQSITAMLMPAGSTNEPSARIWPTAADIRRGRCYAQGGRYQSEGSSDAYGNLLISVSCMQAIERYSQPANADTSTKWRCESSKTQPHPARTGNGPGISRPLQPCRRNTAERQRNHPHNRERRDDPRSVCCSFQ